MATQQTLPAWASLPSPSFLSLGPKALHSDPISGGLDYVVLPIT
jgi:hypothetical protein